MGKGYSKDLRMRAVAAYERGDGTYAEISERFDIGEATLNRWLRLKRETGSVAHRPLGGGNRSVFDSEGLERLVALVEERPDATVAELQAAWNQKYGDGVSRAAVSRALGRAGFTRKKSHSGHVRQRLSASKP